MIILHQLITQVRPFATPPTNWTATKCNPNQPARNVQGAYTLGDAIKKLDYSPQSVLCSNCFYQAVGQIKFDDGPSYGEEIAHMLNEAKQEVKLVLNREYGKYTEIEEGEILEEE